MTSILLSSKLYDIWKCEIIKILPLDSLLRLRLICKGFRKLIDKYSKAAHNKFEDGGKYYIQKVIQNRYEFFMLGCNERLICTASAIEENVKHYSRDLHGTKIVCTKNKIKHLRNLSRKLVIFQKKIEDDCMVIVDRLYSMNIEEGLFKSIIMSKLIPRFYPKKYYIDNYDDYDDYDSDSD